MLQGITITVTTSNHERICAVENKCNIASSLASGSRRRQESGSRLVELLGQQHTVQEDIHSPRSRDEIYLSNHNRDSDGAHQETPYSKDHRSQVTEADYPVAREDKRFSLQEGNFLMPREKRRRISGQEEDFQIAHEERRMSRHEGDFPMAREEQRRIYGHEGDFPMAYEELRMSHQEKKSYGSKGERRMSRFQEDFPLEDFLIFQNERRISRYERESYEERQNSHHVKDSHKFRDETPMSRQERDSHSERWISHHKRDSNGSREERLTEEDFSLDHELEEQRMSRHVEDFHVSLDVGRMSNEKLQMSHQKRNSHESRDEKSMSRKDTNSHQFRDKIRISRQESDIHRSHDERPMSCQEKNSHKSHGEKSMSRKDRNSHLSHDERPRQERNSHEFRDKRRMSRQERNSHEFRDKRPMSCQERNSHKSRDEKSMSRKESNSNQSRDKIRISRQESDIHRSHDERPMSCQEKNSHKSHGEKSMSRKDSNSNQPGDKIRISRQESDIHRSHDERPMSCQEKNSHKSHGEKSMSRQERNSHEFRDKRRMSRQERNSHEFRDKRPKSCQERNSHKSRDEKSMSRKESNSNQSRDKRRMSRQERDIHRSHDERPMSCQERNSHDFRDKRPMSRQEWNLCGSHEERQMSCHERDQHGPRDERPMSFQERDCSGPRYKRHLSHQDRNSPVSCDKKSFSHQERDSFWFRRDAVGSVAVPNEAIDVLNNPKKRRRESASDYVPVHSPTPGTSGYSLSSQGNSPQRKRKRNRSFGLENQHIPEKKGKRDAKPICYKALQNVCCKEDQNEAMSELVKIEERYIALLNSQERIREDLFKLVIESLMVLIESTNRKTSAYVILQATHKQLLGIHFPEFIKYLPQMNCSSEDEVAEVISKIISILEAFFQRFANEKAMFYLVQMVVTALSDKVDPLYQQERVDERILHRIASLKNTQDPFHKASATDDTIDPPDDFRKISVVPSEADFQEVRPFLRANVVNSTYRDTEHYLDVQFRLLREDFIMPLREGIQELRRKGNGYHGKKEENTSPQQKTFLYRDVRIINSVCHRNGGVYRIQINKQVGRLKHVNWRKLTLKRLKYGALVCLSADAFNTLLFAIVENRDFCDLEFGLMQLRFENCDINVMQDAIENKCVFQMIESEAYFEAYRHNLNALQAMDEKKLPFKECIVHCKNADVPPSYMVNDIFTDDDEQQEDRSTQSEDLSSHQNHQSSADEDYMMQSDEKSSFETEDRCVTSDENLYSKHFEVTSEDHKVKYMDMTSMAHPEFLQKYELDVSRVPVENLHQWPCKEALGLDESQYIACQQALNHRFALIQGPPGTGKTYVGLKIAHVLLDNRDLWNGEDKSPILMVSYTNHALDQFLMGLSNKEGIVRVGGRSKEEKLKDCNIKELRTKRRKTKLEDANKKERGRIWRERKTIEEDYFPNEASRSIADGYKGVLSLSKLDAFMKQRHLICLTSSSQNITEDSQLLQWLGVRRKDKEQPQADCEKVKHHGGMFQSEDFRRIIAAAREFEVEEEDDDRSTEREGPAVVCYVKDAKNPQELYSQLQSQETMSDVDEESAYDLFKLSRDRRWNLYRLWRSKLERSYKQRITDCQEEGYETLLMRLSEINADEDYCILRDANVIAMTTTCAARYRDILQRVKPKIVIVEEAAEVLEAHILTSLPLDCEHVILIGDHQQLRPSCTVYELAKKYNLNISMFERMVKLQMPCVKLTVQHRMRPEIASLVRHIYKDLTNHHSVHDYGDVLGLQHNMFFVDHRHSESDSEDSFSHFNEHEARFILKLCRYIMQQGYGPSQMTILTPYLGQMFMIRDHMAAEEEDLTEAIDNYQGEENDIILLSLVRSNDNGHVGFVNDINRACVALSRARMGLYVIGNFDLLSRKSSIWKKVVGDVKKSGKLGKDLALRCQRHKTKIAVREPKDFLEKVPCGGCSIACNFRLDCGHACTLPCHPYDQEHNKSRCSKPCLKKIHGCRKGHICRNRCGQECEPRCVYQVEMNLPCNHVKKNARCSDNPRNVKCDERCPEFLKCGHQCQSRCGQPCTTACLEYVKRNDWPCGHEVTIACSATPLDCRGPCGKISCGHECLGRCGECLQGRVHRRCTKTCGRVLVCGHACRANCTITCPPCTNSCETKCKHSECRRSCNEPCVPCSHQCEWKCEHLKCNMKCGEICDRQRCNEPCGKRLQCKHWCRGLCNEPCICVRCEKNEIEELFGTEDFDDETVRFIQLKECKHIFEVSALDHWVDMENDDPQEKNSIQPKVCPSCKTPIRTMMRYNNVIKNQREDIERVKAKMLNENQPLSERRKDKVRHKLTEYRLRVDSGSSAGRKRSHFELLLKRIDRAKHVFEIITFENQVELLTRCHKLIKRATEIKTKIGDKTSTEMKDVSGSILVLEYLKEKRIVGSVEREITDIELELTRQKVVIEMCSILTETKNRDISLSSKHRTLLDDIRNKLVQTSINEQSELDSHLRKIEETRSKYSIDQPTREEKDQIIKAMGLTKGHWYKCRQGHVYAIGECGGAMETGTCPECHDVIGGTSHKLVGGNEVATEMDGARYGAWSEQANMENYDPRDLQD